MEEFIRIFLPLYLIAFFGIAFVAKSILVAKEIGKSPLVLPNNDTAYGLIGTYFKLEMALMLIYVVAYGINPCIETYLLPITQLKTNTVKYIGIGLMIFALIWTIIAQNQMKDSWRIGIDTETQNDLVTNGLFQYSRNPIFLGMIISLIGLFLITPNALTLLFLILGYLLIQIQIRLEEEFLAHQYGQEYIDYKSKVRRLI